MKKSKFVSTGLVLVDTIVNINLFHYWFTLIIWFGVSQLFWNLIFRELGTHASIDKYSFGDFFLVIFDLSYVKGDSFILHNFTFGDYTIKYRTSPLLFKMNFYRTSKIIPCDDFSKELKNNYFIKFKEILWRQYEKECLVREFYISYFVFIDVFNLWYVCSRVLHSNVLCFRYYWRSCECWTFKISHCSKKMFNYSWHNVNFIQSLI